MQGDTRMNGFRGWQQIGATMLLQAASSGSIFVAYSVIAGTFNEAFQPSRMLLMMAITSVLIGTGVLSPVLGRAMERRSLRTLMRVGSLALGLGFVALSQTRSMAQVLAVYLAFLSVAAVLTGPIAGSALLARWFSRRRGLAMSLSAGGAAVGGLIAPPLLHWLIDALAWRQALLVYGIGLLVIAGAATLLVIDRPSDVGQSADGADAVADAPRASADNPGFGYYLADRNFWLLGIVLGILFASAIGITANLVQFGAEIGIDAGRAALLLSIFAGANFVGKLAAGALADRLDPRLLLAGIVVLFTAGVLCFTQLRLYALLMARFYGPDRVGSSMGMMSMILTPFNLVAPPLFGLVSDRTGSYYGAYVADAALLLLALLLLGLIREHGRR